MRRASSLLDMSGYVPVMTSTPQVAALTQSSLTQPQLANSLQEKMEQQNKVSTLHSYVHPLVLWNSSAPLPLQIKKEGPHY